VASLGVGGEGLMPSMHEALHFPTERQAASVIRRDGAHAEDLIRADGYASFLTLAAIPIDHGFESSRFCAALCFLITHRGIQSIEKTKLTLFMQGKTSFNLLAASAALLGFLFVVPMANGAELPVRNSRNITPVEAEFRGCYAAGYCRFWVEPSSPMAESLLRVRPDGISQTSSDYGTSVAIRDRLNALLSNMIHQAKHIVLLDLRKLGDGTFAATVIVNDADVAPDPVLLELNNKIANTSR